MTWDEVKEITRVLDHHTVRLGLVEPDRDDKPLGSLRMCIMFYAGNSYDGSVTTGNARIARACLAAACKINREEAP